MPTSKLSWRVNPAISEEKKQEYRDKEKAHKRETRKRKREEAKNTTTCVTCCDTKEKTECVACEKCPLQVCITCVDKMCGDVNYGPGSDLFESLVLKCSCGADRIKTNEVIINALKSHSENLILVKAEQLFNERWKREEAKSLEEREYSKWKTKMEAALNIKCPKCDNPICTDVCEDFFEENCTVIYCDSINCKQNNSKSTKICGWCWCDCSHLNDEWNGEAHTHATYCGEKKKFMTSIPTDSFIKSSEDFVAWIKCRDAKINEQRNKVLNELKLEKKGDHSEQTKKLFRNIRQIGGFSEDEEVILLDDDES